MSEDYKQKFKTVNLYFQDESRFGLFTKNGKALTAKGVKPICPYHQVYKSTYLFVAFSPITGSDFMMELPKCNAETFQIFLDHMEKEEPDELKILTLDNGAFHKAKALVIPDNIVLLFLPPYSPELNPAEKMWAKFKRTFTNRLFHTIESLSQFIYEEAKTVNETMVKSTCSYSYIFEGGFWTI